MIKRKGFTLLELITSVTIVAIFAGIVLPRVNVMIERHRSAEAVGILTAVRGAQERYAIEHGGIYAIQRIEIDIDTTGLGSRNFDDPDLSNAGNAGPCNSGVELASIDRNTNAYTMTICNDGEIVCTGDALLCSKMGY